MKYKILFDLSSLQGEDRKRGIGRWAKNFLNSFLSQSKTDYDVHFLLSDLYLDQVQKIQYDLEEFIKGESNFHVWSGIPFNLSSGSEIDKSYYEFNAEIKKNIVENLSPDIFFNFHQGAGLGDYSVTHLKIKNKKIKQVSVVYDFIPNEYPKEFLTSKLSKDFNKSYLKELKNQDYLVTISEFTRQQAIKRLNYPENDIISAGTGISSKFIKKDKTTHDKAKREVKPKLFSKIKNPFLLSVGVFEWRKNFDSIIKAYKYLDRGIKKNCDLVLISPFETPLANIYMSLAKKYKVKLHIFYGISDTELEYLYRKCKLFIFPSLAEGFGLPVLESIHSGSLTICSGESSIPEIINYDKKYLFNPKKPKEIAEKITHFSKINNFELSKHKKEQLEYVNKWTWENAAQIFINFIESKQLKTAIQADAKRIFDSRFAKKIAGKAKLIDSSQLVPASKALAKNFPLRKRYLLLDVSIISQGDSKSGIQRVVRNTIWNLLSRGVKDYEVKLVSFENGGFIIKNNFEQQMRAFLKNLNINMDLYSSDEEYLPLRGDIFLGLDLNHALYRDNVLSVNNLKANGVKFLNIVYDVLPLTSRDSFANDMPWFHKIWIDAVLFFGDVISISKTTSEELEKYISQNGILLDQPRKLFSYINGGVQDDLEVIDAYSRDKIRKKTNKPIYKNCFVMLGTIEPRKNHEQVFSVFQNLWKSGSEEKLLIIGKQGWKVERFISKLKKNKNFNSKVFWLDDLNDAEVNKILSCSKGLIFASENEGLGLPIVEAAQHNLTIFAHDIPVFKEVGQGDIHYFKHHEELEQLINDFQEKESKPIVERISWNKSYKKLIDIIEGNYQEDFIVENNNPVNLFDNTNPAFKINDKSIHLKSNLKEEIFFHGSYHNLYLGDYNYALEINSKLESSIKIRFMIGYGAANVLEKKIDLKKGKNKISFDISVNDSIWTACEVHLVNSAKKVDIALKKIEFKRRNT